MKIFGIGLSRTGTVSLTIALKILGYNVIHSPRPELVPELLHELRKWDGATDAPIALAFEEIDRMFPDSKFILTTRSLESWLKSYENYLSKRPKQATNVAVMQKKLYGSVEFNKEEYTKAFNKHHAKVIEYYNGFFKRRWLGKVM